MIKRVPTGIDGFDKLIGGGFIDGSSILVCGAPGTGKSIFALQYLYNGAAKYGDNGLYVSIEEKPENLKAQGEEFGWNFKFLEEKGKISFLKIPVDVTNINILDLIKKEATRIKAKRVVIDSLSVLAINAPRYIIPIIVNKIDDPSYIVPQKLYSPTFSNEEISQFIYIFMNRIEDLGATCLFIADSPSGTDAYLTRDTVSEFICDGVVLLKMLTMGKTANRTLEIRKMRGTELNEGINSIKFSKNGIKITGFEY